MSGEETATPVIDVDGAERPVHRARLGRTALLALAIIAGIEIVNAARLWLNPGVARVFPYGYVSQGVWSIGGFFRRPDTYNTDIAPSIDAAGKLLRRDGRLYADFQRAGPNFLYPPSAAVMLLPLGWIASAYSSAAATSVMDVTGRLCALATIAIAAGLLRTSLGRAREWAFAVLVLAAFYPLRWMVVCVQAQSLVTVFLAGAILAHAHSRRIACGILIGLAACLKPHLALLVLFAVARREWRTVLASIATGALLILASTVLVGFAPWRSYVLDITPVMSAGYAFQPNQSINGIVHRWLRHPSRFELGPTSPAVSIATWSATIAFALLAVLPRSTRSSRTDRSLIARSAVALRAIDIGIATLAVTLASPIVWEHYYAWVIVLFAACVAAARSGTLPRPVWGALAVAYVSLAAYILPVQRLMAGPLSLINAPQFIGAVLLMATAWYAQWRLAHAGPRTL